MINTLFRLHPPIGSTAQSVPTPFFGSAPEWPAYDRVMGDTFHPSSTSLQGLMNQLPEPVRTRVAGYTEHVTPVEIQRYEQASLFGILEESADVVFEAYKLKARREGIVNADTLERLSALVTDLREIGLDYIELLKGIQSEVLGEREQPFARALGIPEPFREKLLIPILLTNALWCSRYPEYNQVRKNLVSETSELMKEVPGHLGLKMKLGIYALGLRYLDNMPIQPFLSMVQTFAEIGLELGPLRTEDLLAFVDGKQRSRQEVNYYQPDASAKRLLKPFERILEASVLKDIESRQI